VAIFGPREVVDGLTKKFSVYSAVAAFQRIAAAAIPQSEAPPTGVDADLPVTGR